MTFEVFELNLAKKSKTIKRKIGKHVKNLKKPFKRKKRRKKKEKKKRIASVIPCNICCCVGVIILLIGGMFAFGGGQTLLDGWFSTETDTDEVDTTTTTTVPVYYPPPDDDEDIYYQLGLEFPIRNEDIDVLMIVEVNTSDHLTFIESFGLGPIGLSKSANDYKPGDMFFLYMFYGDVEYNITFSTVLTVGEEQDITVYMNGVAIDEIINVTWIADGSGTRWDYP